MDTALVWFRRDLRLGDLPTLHTVAESGARALGLFVLDDRLLKTSGGARRDFLFRSLAALDDQLDGRLLVVKGDPVDVVPRVAKKVSAEEVHVSADYGPYGRERDAAVAEHVDLVATGSPYAVAPGRVTKTDGEPYRVFTPYFRQWLEHGWRAPIDTGRATVEWLDPEDVKARRVQIPEPESDGCPAGEAAALQRWAEFCEGALAGYEDARDRPGLDATSRMSVYLKYGNIHPRTMLRDLARRRSKSAEQYRRQLAWRDFYADILFQRPDSARENYDRRFDRIRYDSGPDAEEAYSAWCEGRTGFPIVDAGMRQLKAEAWMHNRVRMIVASFFVKDLHLPWWWGARYFMNQLVDGDLANNQHGWQWTAGSGTDASPYFRVFNPTTQGEKFDPDGEYVRRWVPELRGIAGKAVHALKDGRPEDYPPPIVDHAHERQEALARYGEIKAL
ncbi:MULTISPECIES: cryptochrome/photolyase family protein [Rhodococcus]|uniref:Deoxyribodipyrimidine photo-lyase n=1 Tax=Rhodococcus opacus RKJ300 = JCM 13270 TaxID=1165867 RepID=I0WQX3_RHOOP|nr:MULTISPECIES: deoxyribodipyrimidine photo-lyase [Rhodococcus]EID78789.1 deoxyribodipyrimidine photo-lyase [Rhodococcus opacus RKJ300 = JCM 13270]QQZ12920.1 deoxyribodipyrimidine photo-lyase [Rhodococcus sp. 21391]